MKMDWIKPQTFETTVVDLLYTPLDGEPISTQKLRFFPEGPLGDYHSGLHTLSTVREKKLTPKGSYVLNTRQITLTSQGESEEVAGALGISEITPADLMSNLHLEGLPFLSMLPIGSYVQFHDGRKNEGRPTLFITGINDPCLIPRQRIDERLGETGIAKGYEKESYGKRGLLAMVWKPGYVKLGDTARIITPRMVEPGVWMESS